MRWCGDAEGEEVKEKREMSTKMKLKGLETEDTKNGRDAVGGREETVLRDAKLLCYFFIEIVCFISRILAIYHSVAELGPAIAMRVIRLIRSNDPFRDNRRLTQNGTLLRYALKQLIVSF